MPRGAFNGGKGVTRKIEKAHDVKYTLKRLGQYLWKYKWGLLLAVVLTVSASFFNLIGPELSGNAIDAIDAGVEGTLGTDEAMRDVLKNVILMIIFYFSSALLNYVLAMLMTIIAKKIVYQMRKDAFDKLMQVPVSYFDKNPIGDIISVISYDVDTVNTSLSSDVVTIVSSIFTIIFSLVMMLRISPVLVLIFVVTIPLSIFYTKALVKKTRKLYSLRSRKLGELNAYSEEMITGNKSIKSYSQEERVIEGYAFTNKEATDAYYHADYYGCYMGPGVNFFNNLALSLVCIGGALLHLFSGFSYGSIAKFVQYSRKFSGPINEIANLFADFQSALAAAERVFILIDQDVEKKDEEDALVLNEITGDVSFKDVSFGYVKEKEIIHHLSFDAPDGKQIAIVGPTGSGKTTLVNLLMRFYDVDKGDIALDEHSIYSVKRSDLRSHFAMVLQDTWLFQGSVYDNLVYGRDDVTMEEVEEAAKASHIHEFIISLPDGYNTILNEGGINISKGQKQLLTIARAMLLKADLLILDEATSNVDTRTEILIQEAMKELMKDKTCFIIAHRLSTIRNADKIIVIKDGSILEEGSHEELMSKESYYKTLYNSQFE